MYECLWRSPRSVLVMTGVEVGTALLRIPGPAGHSHGFDSFIRKPLIHRSLLSEQELSTRLPAHFRQTYFTLLTVRRVVIPPGSIPGCLTQYNNQNTKWNLRKFLFCGVDNTTNKHVEKSLLICLSYLWLLLFITYVLLNINYT